MKTGHFDLLMTPVLSSSQVVKSWRLDYTDSSSRSAKFVSVVDSQADCRCCAQESRRNTQGEMMSVKPDKWIRRMSLEHKMIEPFTDRQVREGVISYGVSSYGYDIRVADEFRIFTNVNSTIVDPKHFDPRSLVDYKGDVCI